LQSDSNDFYVPGLMDLSRYSMRRAELDEDWDNFVEASPQGTIFSSTAFLSALPFRPAAWFCYKKNQRVGAAVLIETDDGEATRIAPHVIYGGFLLAPAPPEQQRSQTYSEDFRITSAMLRDLAAHYRSLNFNASPALVDMRPFLWHNYGTPAPKIAINLRYTSYVTLAETAPGTSLDVNPIYLACNKSRRQTIRYGLEEGVTVEETNDVDGFVSLYIQTFERQGLAVDHDEILLLSSVCKAMFEAGKLRMFAARTSDGALGSVVVFGMDSKRVYYLYGANSPDLRSQHCGTLALFEALTRLGRDGYSEADLEGINSPKRGYFKLSFGGDIRSYSQVSYPAP